MSEVSLKVPVGDLHLEALLREGRGPETVVLCHPHPLYGGSMDNNVIHALMKTMWDHGWGTLRFNFRGVGGSGGEYADGEGEVEDVLGVASYLLGRGAKTIHLAGYSFGAWIALKAIRNGLQPESLILVSPPLDMLSFGDLGLPSIPCLITLGDRDDFCSVQSLRDWTAHQSSAETFAEVGILPGCTHFHWQCEETLSTLVAGFLDRRFKPDAC